MLSHAAVWSYAKVVSAMDNGAGNVFTAVVSFLLPLRSMSEAGLLSLMLVLLALLFSSTFASCCHPRIEAELSG